MPKVYKKDKNVTNWLVSEKLDGMRAYWDGEKLLTKYGNIIQTPKDFTKNFPNFPLDGELWSNRGEFEKIVSIVKDKIPSKEWQEIKYYIFDVPIKDLKFIDRIQKAQDWFMTNQNLNVVVLEQKILSSKKEMFKYFNEVIKKGGEGVILRDPNSYFEIGRSESLLKLKPYEDLDCIVIGYKSGKGKLEGKIGSLLVKYENIEFFVGAGLTDRIRENPPKIGDVVTIKYNGFTKRDKPRHPVFLRIKKDI